MRFRSAVLGAMLALVVSVLAAAIIGVIAIINRSARRDVEEQVARTQQVFEELHGYRESLYRSEARVVAEEPRLKAVVATEEITHETVLGVAQELRQALSCDLFLMTDGQGRLTVDVLNPTASGDDMKGNRLIAAALANGEGSGVWVGGGKVYQVQSRRLAFGATVVGVVAIGYRLDDRAAQTVARQTASAVEIDLDGAAIAASTLDAGKPPNLATLGPALASVPTGGGTMEVTVEGQRYVAAAAPLPGFFGQAKLRYVVMRSLDAALAPGRRLALALYVTLVTGVLAALAIASLLSSRLSRPIDALVRATQQVAKGDLAARVTPEGPIELVALGESMNAMIAEIERARAALVGKRRLEQELEIAMRIQTSILPRKVKVPGLELAATMIPASEVGGDYYDVQPTKDGAWIGVGDVAGHGLPAGLLMLMIQSTVSALVRALPDVSPAKAVCLLNDVLYQNVRDRLVQNEFATFTLLRFRDNGTVVFAGAHEEIVVWRKATGKTERLQTPGTWLAAAKDISRSTVDVGMVLRPDDLVVLYSDGLTEAKNAKGEQYELDRLCAVVEKKSGDPVEKIRDAIIADAKAFMHEQADDMTLLVLRYVKEPPPA